MSVEKTDIPLFSETLWNMEVPYLQKKAKKKKMHKNEIMVAYICLIPSIIGLIFLTYVPLAAVLGLSFTKWEGVGTPEWVGLSNYIKLFTTDPYFVDSIKVTIYFSFIAVIGSFIYSLAIALLLNRKIPARGFFRAVF